MRINVKVKLGGSIDRVEAQPDGSYLVYTKSSPVKGRANAAIQKLLAEYFKVPKTSVGLVLGRTSREKLWDIAV